MSEDPERPDDGDWDCYAVGESDVCVGDHFPDSGDSWDWDEEDEMAVCENPDGDRPTDSGEWDCAGGEDVLQCITGGPDEPVEVACEPGTERSCEEPVFGSWGLQACEESRGEARWGTCLESSVPEGCEPGGAHARDYDWVYAGGNWDGQVNEPERVPPPRARSLQRVEPLVRSGEIVAVRHRIGKQPRSAANSPAQPRGWTHGACTGRPRLPPMTNAAPLREASRRSLGFDGGRRKEEVAREHLSRFEGRTA